MLVITRRLYERIQILVPEGAAGKEISVEIRRTGHQIRLAIDAPRDFLIKRGEFPNYPNPKD